MQEHLSALASLHDDLVAAIDSGDADLVVELVERREIVIDTLKRDYIAADTAARESIQPQLAALLPLDGDLQARAGGLHDHLRSRLDEQQTSTPRRERTVVTGVFDRQA